MSDMNDALKDFKYAGKITLGDHDHQCSAGLAAYCKLLRVQEGASPAEVDKVIEEIKEALGLKVDQDDDVIALTGGTLTAERRKMLEGLLASKRDLVCAGVNQHNAGKAAYWKLLCVQEGASPVEVDLLLKEIKDVLGLDVDRDDSVIALTGGTLTAKRLKMLEGLLASKRDLVRAGVNQHNAGKATYCKLLRVQEGASPDKVKELLEQIKDVLGLEVGQDDDVIALTGGTLTAERLKMLEGLLASKRDLVRAGVNQHNAGKVGGKTAYCKLLRVQEGADGVDVDLLIQEIEALGLEVGQDDDVIALTGGTLTAKRLIMLKDLLAGKSGLVCGGVNQSRAGESSAPRRGLQQQQQLLLLLLRLPCCWCWCCCAAAVVARLRVGDARLTAEMLLLCVTRFLRPC
jgi:hypothetical protein